MFLESYREHSGACVRNNLQGIFHVATAATERMMAPQMQALRAMHFRIMLRPSLL